MPDLHDLAAAADAMAGELTLLRHQQAAAVAAVRRRTRMLAALIVVVLAAAVGVTTAGLVFNRGVHCGFYSDLADPPPDQAPTAVYGKRIVHDASDASQRLHC